MSVLAVSWDPREDGRRRIDRVLDGVADVVYLTDLDREARAAALAGTDVLLTRHTGKEIHADEHALLSNLSLIQFLSAGVDFVPLGQLPPHIPVAGNGGAYAEPMAEHALAMILAAAKRLIAERANLARGEFNQFTPTRMLRGMTVGILGFGGIGVATARLLRPLGLKIHAINRRGTSETPVDWIGTPDRLDEMLGAADVLVISASLTRQTLGMIGARELALMKPDAILVNLARGEIVDEAALYAHLKAHPDFIACLDAWWIEPVRHGEFRMDQPFLELPNVIGSPHNSAQAGVPGAPMRNAARNVRRALSGEPPLHLIGEDERLA